MPTYDERREVARRLREIRPCKSGHIEWWKIAQALGLKESAGWFGWEKFEPDSVNRLADLIEPSERTCHYYDSETNRCGCYDTRLVDRDALLALADTVHGMGVDCDAKENYAFGCTLRAIADRIREALGVSK